jgi:hypothetical protein
VAAIPDEAVRQDCLTLVEFMRRLTGSEPAMWGGSIVGFGQHDLAYAGGRTRAWPCLAFAPRKRELALYVILPGEDYTELLDRLGKHRVGKSCLWVKRLSDIDMNVLERIAVASLGYIEGCERQ